MNPRQASLNFILFTVFLDVLGIGLMIPVLPSLIGTLTDSSVLQAYWFGLLATTYGVMQFFCTPLLGALSDRYGRRPVLLLSIFGLGMSYIVTALTYSLWLLLATRLVSGATGATFSVANAYVADITSPEQRGKAFGQIGAAFGVGFIFGPMIGGSLSAIDLRLPFLVAAALSLANWLYGYFVLPESLAPTKRSAINWRKANPFGALMHLGKLKGVGQLVLVFCCSALAQFILQNTWVLYTEFRFGWRPQDNGIALFVVGMTSAITQGVLMATLLKRFGELKLAIIGMLSAGIINIAYGLTTHTQLLYVLILMNFLSFAVNPALQSFISKAASEHEQGLTQGALNAINSIMIIIAPLIGTFLLAQISHLDADNWLMGITFFVCAGLHLLGAILTWRHFRLLKSTS
ncbi:TCR/Tet family MFS transporter [Agitococcus lubricus]|uniref:DHA1 family tetracycline resistance protein-like MFS transporter n=1 Tax=Agitococcus lubricus TaxID=1077255 RepID=A0A2T5IYE3_9GAMM|nr:TCR/Tet family MFS transporter [Agitococcus lubricus]PTQ89011.1 DHA1 family tetracycline resistance protein-like MFS transporter [Agitococcus lubricus]